MISDDNINLPISMHSNRCDTQLGSAHPKSVDPEPKSVCGEAAADNTNAEDEDKRREYQRNFKTNDEYEDEM